MNKKIKILIFVFVLIAAIIFLYKSPNQEVSQQITERPTENIKNYVTLTNKAQIPESEKDQLVISVDEFMTEYKLPKGVENSYSVSIEKILNDSVQIIVNQGEEGDLGNIVIYARKANGTWQVDPEGGPWCTLEEFDNGDC